MIRASSCLRKPVILWMVLTICLILLSGCSPSLTTGGHSTPEIKALALDALGIKVYARGIDNVEIQGVIPLELPTTEQTSGCLISCTYEWPSGEETVNIIPGRC